MKKTIRSARQLRSSPPGPSASGHPRSRVPSASAVTAPPKKRRKRKPSPDRPSRKSLASANKPLFPIVGLGASAGGLEAITELLQAMPPNPGMAFVVMQHLDPTHESALPTLLGRATSLSVTEAKHNLRIEINRVYVIPPNKAMRVAGRRLKVTERKTEKEQRLPIDRMALN